MVHYSMLSLALIISMLGLCLLLQASLAQTSQKDYLSAQNEARVAVGVGPLVWDYMVEAFVQEYAKRHIGDCNMVHSGGPYGENLAKSTGDLSVTAVVNSWVGENCNFDYKSNSCVGRDCLHYTQVVSRNSTRVGCAKVRCNNGGTLIGCNYDPPGCCDSLITNKPI